MAVIDLDRKIKQAVKTWREQDYAGTGPVTRRLLEFWLCQREGIEALIYVYEVCRYRILYDLARVFSVGILFDPTRDLWPKVSETQPLHISELVTKVKKTVFDELPYPRRSAFEKEFMVYLDERDEMIA